MRAGIGLTAFQHTLTPEAAAVVDHSIAEAGRRNHGQTTPLHVAATLLAAPSGFLRQACIRSHPNSSHPLQCRALELCFCVALERLPTAQNMEPGMEPPISNALTAALKRAQAHQRRGYPEQQQQPLLAVRAELEQLIISILDDPSVSRVMREASFSSPAVKATIEQSLNNENSNPKDLPYYHPHPRGNVNLGMFGGIGHTAMLANPGYAHAPTCMSSNPNRNMYVNPKLKQGVAGQLGNQRNDQVKKILDILMRRKKRNPVLVGESEPEAVVKELIRRINHSELGCDPQSFLVDLKYEFPLNNVQVISIEKELNLDKNRLVTKLKELGDLVECRIKESAGVVLDLGNLKWLVDQQSVNSCTSAGMQQQVVSETGNAVMEMGMLLSRFRETNKACMVWLIGTATCETYLRCQVYHPNLENDWDLQAIPIAGRLPMPGLFPRFEVDGNLSNSIEPLIPVKSFQTTVPALTRRQCGNLDPSLNLSAFQQNAEKITQELNVPVKDLENSSESKSEPVPSSLPQWLRSSRLHNGEVKASDQLQDQEILLNINNLNQNGIHEKTASADVSPMSLYNPKLLAHQPIQPKLKTCSFGDTLQLNSNVVSTQPSQQAGTPPGNLVRTDLVLGRKVSETTTPENIIEDTVKDFFCGISIEPQMKFVEQFANPWDAASFKKLLKCLMDSAWWQPEAASAVASAVTRCPLCNGKRQASGSKGDIWLLFTGPDRIGKRKMVSVLSEEICGASPTMISLGSTHDDDEEPDINIRCKTTLDRIVEAVRRNPFSVIMLEDIDEADFLLRGSINRAMERGRLTDSHGREISLGNVIFVLTGNWSNFQNDHSVEETKLASTPRGNWHLKLTIGENTSKRRAHWMPDADRSNKPWKEPISGLSFDLNQVAVAEYDKNDGSHNSSSLTVDHEEEHDLETRQLAITSVPQELVNFADTAIVFKPVDFAFVRREIKKTISVQFSMVVTDDNLSIQVEDNALEKILGGLWHGRSNLGDWVGKALAPAFEQLKTRVTSSTKSSVVQLRLDESAVLDGRSNGDWYCIG